MNQRLFPASLVLILAFFAAGGAMGRSNSPLFAARRQAPSDAEAIRHHRFRAGETLRYFYEDTDTTFPPNVTAEGTIEAGAAFRVQEIRIPVKIELLGIDGDLVRKVSILPEASYRSGAPNALASIPFQPLKALVPVLAAGFSYTCKDDTDALNRLQKIFEDIRRDETGGFLFFKMQDVHQMQESTERLPEGLTPGRAHFSPGEERQGLGGDFVSPPGQVIYQGAETWDGLRAGYVKAIALGLRFKTGPLTVYTNFFFTLHVGLKGAFRGLLLYGEGQETATVFNKDAKTGTNKPMAVLQRRFSIRLLR